MDLENSLLGLPSVYRRHLLEIRKIYVSLPSGGPTVDFDSSREYLIGCPWQPLNMLRWCLLSEPLPLQTHADEAVYGFGHMLYEMTLGQPLKTPTMETLPPSTPDTMGMPISGPR